MTFQGKTVYVPIPTKVTPCPACRVPFFTRRIGGVSVAIHLRDKFAVDNLIIRLNTHLKALRGIDNDGGLGEATVAERKFAYDLVEWMSCYLAGDARVADAGMDTYEAIDGFMAWLLEKEWWRDNLKSLLMIYNQRTRLVDEYLHMVGNQIEQGYDPGEHLLALQRKFATLREVFA